MLALVLAAFFVPVGLLAAMPATQPLGTAVGFLTATLLSLQNAYSADFVTYADGGFAALLGVAGAAVMTALMRSVGAEWSARRLLRANWRDLAAIPRRQTTQDSNALAGLLLDRLGLLVPRLAAVGEGNDLAAVDVLADLRIGINMIDLWRDYDADAAAGARRGEQRVERHRHAVRGAGGRPAMCIHPHMSCCATSTEPWMRPSRSPARRPATCCCNWWVSGSACSPMPHPTTPTRRRAK